jgi:hypothetical protein
MATECELTGQPMAVLAAIGGRAEYLYHVLKAMDEAGVEDADEILKKAIYEVGRTWAKKLGEVKDPSEFWNKLLTDDLRQILKLDWVKDTGDEVELHFYRCPLVWRWEQMDTDPETVERLCNIAKQVDYGNLESFGFELDMDSGLGRGDERCTLRVKKKEPA